MKNRSIISVTTIPSRIHFIERNIKSLCYQGHEVYLWIVEQLKRTGQKFDGVIPIWFRDYDFDYEIVDDNGPITKLLPALNIDTEYIITADDDVIYPDGWANNLLYWSKKLNATTCYRCKKLDFDTPYNEIQVIKYVNEPIETNMISGTWGCCYKKEYFLKDVIKENAEKFPLVDDVVISAHLYNKRIKMYCVPSDEKIIPYFPHKIDSLYKENNKKTSTNNDEAIQTLYNINHARK